MKTDKAPRAQYRLIIQPGAGLDPLIEAIDDAKTRIEILIFRFDRAEVEKALIRAVSRGVVVQALIAWTNHGGERNLRSLEARLLAAGVTVSRTASDLVRYHGKMMIVDRRVLLVLGFNYTALDIDRSRSFGIVTTSRTLVNEAVKLFECDSNRQPYKPGLKTLLVSPFNSRPELAAFIEGAKKELLIYDPGLSDPQMIRLLDERGKAGLKIRIIGELKKAAGTDLMARPLAQMRLHTRTIIRDGVEVFLGSQSLRAAELDARREVGIIVSDKDIAAAIQEVFEGDWALAEETAAGKTETPLQGDKLAKKVAKAVVRELPPVAEVIEAVASQVDGMKTELQKVDLEALDETVRSAVKTAVREAIQGGAGENPT